MPELIAPDTHAVHLIGDPGFDLAAAAGTAGWGDWAVTGATPWEQAMRGHSLGIAQAAAMLVVVPDLASLDDVVASPGWPQWVHDHAVVLLCRDVPPARQLQLLRGGVMEVLDAATATAETALRALRLGLERQRVGEAHRRGWSIDLDTGLPSQALWLELLNQLCALREREPAPMGLVVLRLEGLARFRREQGDVAANLLRRKAAVRLRAGLRSSDVVGVLGEDALAVILVKLEKPQDIDKVATKLAQALSQPYIVNAQQAVLGVAVGTASYPQHATQARDLLSLAQTAASSSHGWRAGMAQGGAGVEAANDD
jgi:diguanylate cyclase (GGDEF)-like protein